MTSDPQHRHGRATATHTDKLPPHSVEAEQSLLGCILLDPVEVLPGMESKFANHEQPFYDPRHQTIIEAMKDEAGVNPSFTIVGLMQLLKDRIQLDSIGGPGYLSSLPESTPSASHWTQYANIVRDKALARRMIQTCSDIITRAYELDGTTPIEEFLDEAEKDILKVSDMRSSGDTECTIKEFVRQAIERMEKKWNADGKPTGLPTGLTDLDQLLSGLHPGEVTIIAARPSEGKSSLAMNIVEHIALDLGHHVQVISIEMLGAALVERMLYARSHVSGRSLINRRNRDSGATEDDFKRITNSAAKIATSKIHIIDKSSMSITELRSVVRRKYRSLMATAADGSKSSLLKVVVIDYLQLLHSTSKKASNRTQEVGEISRGIKGLAKELGVSVVLLSQLNREMEREKNRMPRLSDLRECGDIEQDAHNVIFIWDRNKPAEEDPEHAKPASRKVVLVVAKQREGPRGNVEVVFNANITRFESIPRVQDRDFPI